MVFTGEEKVESVKLSTIRYGPDHLTESSDPTPAELTPPDAENDEILWLNVDGLHDTNTLSVIGDSFGLHPLALEDVANVGGRPQLADYDQNVFASLKMLSLGPEDSVVSEHVSLVVGGNWVVSFQERPGDVFENVRKRLREGRGRIRSRRADYLWYALLDALVDHYILVMDRLAERTEALEVEVWEGEAEADIPARIQDLRKEMLTVGRALRPLRGEIDTLTNAPPELIASDTAPFLADLKDHVLQLSEAQEAMRDSLSSVMDIHFSILSTRMNEVMKVLTIVASIFVPITFIAGVYGMNFEHMPELAVSWAYPLVWVLMGSVAGGMLLYFSRKKWL